DALKPGDWVVVAFGHNDANKAKKERYSSPDDYKALMRAFMEDVRAKGASPVLATSIPHSGGFSEKDGVMSVRGGAAGIGPYVAKTRELAAEMEVPLLDLNRFAEEALPKLGLEKANALYMRIKPGEYKRLPDGLKDGCHTRDTGAYFYARAAVQMARWQKLKICELFKPQDEVAFEPYPWGGPGGDAKPLKDDFSEEEIPYAGAAGVGMRETIQSRIDAASAAGGGVVSVPPGEHAIDGPIRLKSGVELHLEDGATLVFADDPALYLPAVLSSWEGVECLNYSPLVYAYGATNVAITGKGTLAPKMDFWRTWFGRGKGHREATRRLYDWCSFNAPMNERDLTKIPESNVRPHLIQFNRCGNVRLEGFRVRESPFWTIHLFLCDGAVVRGLDVYAHGHNNDGIDIEMTKNVLVENCRFDQGDDAVVVKSGRNQDAWRLACPSENIEVRNCTVVNGHVLLGIGSEMSGGVRNVYMHDCVLESEALRLFYVKVNERRGGFVENIRMENVKAKKVRRGVMAVETDVLYQWKDFPTHEVRVTPIRNLSMKNVAVEEAERLVDIRGDKRLPVDGVTLENVRVAKALKPDRIENAVNVVVNAEGEAAARGAPAAFAWPEPTQTMKPWVYNWWMGSAVDKPGLEFQCRELKDKGFGGFHVIPIYGAKGGYEKNWKPLLSPQWIEAWNLAAGLASYNGLGIDLTMGSGWCFGGPWIDKEHAASSGQKVKRAGLGGTGYMLDPFDPEAMKLHIAQFDKWFGKAAQSVTCAADILVAARPRAFYHDSYEYYGAEPKKGQDVDESQLACFKVWTDWCRENGYLTRNEAHGAPSNWLDFYALADIPETEMFGKNDRDILVSKFAWSPSRARRTRQT
ncbi:MAG: right-handed parallel beta-helix repeat-containing protein, partial [Kiritimatiellae bacterium]|nr:right-handed parallel beta-helix repeat-containing protein [Kiritimatiellia bacterium]